MSWREALLLRFGGGGFAGITLGPWLRVLRDNRFAVDWPYLGEGGDNNSRQHSEYASRRVGQPVV